MPDPRTTIIVGARDEASDALLGIARNMQGIAEAAISLGMGTALSTAATGLQQLAVQASRVDAVRGSFDRLATAAGQNANALVAAMQVAARGTVAPAELMRQANLAMLLMGGQVADKLPKFMEIARASAVATGMSVDYMFESIVRGVGRASPRILDNLGMTISLTETYEKYAKAVGKAVDELSKQEQVMALANEVERQGADFLERMGDGANLAGQAMAGFNVRVQEFKDSVGRALIPALMQGMDIASSFMDVLDSPAVQLLIEKFGGLAAALITVLGPLLMVSGAFKALRALGLLDLIVGTSRAFVGLGSAAVAAAGGLAATVAILGPIAIVLGIAGVAISKNIKAQQELETAAKRAAEAHMWKYDEIIARYGEEGEAIREVATELEIYRAKLLLLQEQAIITPPEAPLPAWFRAEWLQDWLHTLGLYPDTIRIVEGSIKSLEAELEKTKLDVYAKKWDEWATAVANGAESVGKSLAAIPKETVLGAYDRRMAEMAARMGLTMEEMADNVQELRDAEAEALGEMVEGWRGYAGEVGKSIGQLETIETKYADDMRRIGIDLTADMRRAENEYAIERARIIAQGEGEAAGLRAKGRGDEANARIGEMNASVADLERQAGFERAHRQWAADVAGTEAKIARAVQMKELRDDLLAQFAIKQTSAGDELGLLATSLGIEGNMRVAAEQAQRDYTRNYVMFQQILGMSAVEAAMTAALAMANQIEAATQSMGNLKDLRSELENMLINEPLPGMPDLSQYIAQLGTAGAAAGGAGGGAAAREFHSAATESAATVARDMASALDSAKRALASVVGFELPPGIDKALENVATFFEKSITAIYNAIQRSGRKIYEVRGLLPHIKELAEAIVSLNKAMASMVVGRALPDLTTWAANADKAIAAAMGVVERAEAAYGPNRLIKAGGLAGFVGQLAGATGGGGIVINLTVNAPGGDPAEVTRATREGIGQSMSVLRAARAKGIA